MPLLLKMACLQIFSSFSRIRSKQKSSVNVGSMRTYFDHWLHRPHAPQQSFQNQKLWLLFWANYSKTRPSKSNWRILPTFLAWKRSLLPTCLMRTSSVSRLLWWDFSHRILQSFVSPSARSATTPNRTLIWTIEMNAPSACQKDFPFSKSFCT